MREELRKSQDDNGIKITKRATLEDGELVALQVSATTLEQMPLWVGRFKDALPDLILAFRDRLSNGPFSLSDGAMQGVRINGIEVERYGINCLMGKVDPTDIRSINTELDSILREVLTLPIENSASVRTNAPFEELLWTVSTDVQGELRVPLTAAIEIASRGGADPLGKKHEALWRNAIPLIVRARHGRYFWDEDCL